MLFFEIMSKPDGMNAQGKWIEEKEISHYEQWGRLILEGSALLLVGSCVPGNQGFFT